MRLELSTELLLKALAGDQSVKKQILVMAMPKISGVVKRYITDVDDRKDLIQDASLHLLLNLQKYEPNKGDFGAWLYRLTVNITLEWLKKKQKNKNIFIDIDDLIEDVSEDFIDNETLNPDLVLSFLDTLPLGARKVFNMFYIEGLKHQEIAKLLNVSESTSKTQAFKAKNLFIAYLKQNRINA